MSDILNIRNLCVEGRPPGGTPAPIVRDVSLSVARGEVLALIGESGSGKSTISLAAMGFARPGCRISGGEVWLNGRDILRLAPAERHALRGNEVSYVAQSAAAAFNPALRIGSQVIEAPLWHGRKGQKRGPERNGGGKTARDLAEQATALYRKLELPDPGTIGARFPHQVSGGQLQRLMAAMAMSSGPDLLILDEPTTALDVTTQVEVLKAFRDIIRDRGTAAIHVTHDLAVVAQMADRILVLKDGIPVEEGTTARILHDPRHAYTKTLMAAVRPPPHLLAPSSLPSPLPSPGPSPGPSPLPPHLPDKRPEPVEPVLSVRNVTAGYGNTTILHDVSLDLPRGAVVGVIGESGSGKSTLARVIAGLTPRAGGSVLLNGASLPAAVKDRDRQTLRDCQIVFQMADTALNPRQRVGDIIGRPLQFYQGLKGAARTARIAGLLELVDLPPAFAGRYPGALSGGQKQRVNLARALAAEPAVLLCDEVTSALDTVVAAGVIGLLKSLRDRLGISCIFISHDLSTIADFADHIVVMHQGRVVDEGPAREVFSPPYHPYTELLLTSVPEMRQGWLEEAIQAREAKAPEAKEKESGVRP